jgi:hypothetical protein
MDDFALDAPYAYHAPAGADWRGVHMLMNTSDTPLDVKIGYTIGYTDAAAADFTHLDQLFFDVTGCWQNAGSEFIVPGDGGPGSVYEQSHTVTMKRDGVIRFGGGHLHPGGIDVAITGPDGEVCRSIAAYGDGHHDGAHGHHAGMRTTPCPEMEEVFVARGRVHHHGPLPQ